MLCGFAELSRSMLTSGQSHKYLKTVLWDLTFNIKSTCKYIISYLIVTLELFLKTYLKYFLKDTFWFFFVKLELKKVCAFTLEINSLEPKPAWSIIVLQDWDQSKSSDNPAGANYVCGCVEIID